MFGRKLRKLSWFFFFFLRGIVKLICEFRHTFFINLRLQQKLNLRPSALFHKNLRSAAGKFAHSAVCGNTYAPLPPPSPPPTSETYSLTVISLMWTIFYKIHEMRNHSFTYTAKLDLKSQIVSFSSKWAYVNNSVWTFKCFFLLIWVKFHKHLSFYIHEFTTTFIFRSNVHNRRSDWKNWFW